MIDVYLIIPSPAVPLGVVMKTYKWGLCAGGVSLPKTSQLRTQVIVSRILPLFKQAIRAAIQADLLCTKYKACTV